MSKNLSSQHNITLVPLPPKSPELNPVENIWQFLRETGCQTASSNLTKTLGPLLLAWNKLVDHAVAHNVHRIAPMGARVLISGDGYNWLSSSYLVDPLAYIHLACAS